MGDKWIDGDFNWKESVYKFRKMGYSVDYFLDFSVGVDLKNSTTRVIDVSAWQIICNWRNLTIEIRTMHAMFSFLQRSSLEF